MLLCRMRHDSSKSANKYYEECTRNTSTTTTRIYFKSTLQSEIVSTCSKRANKRLSLLKDRRDALREEREREVTLLTQERLRVAEERRLEALAEKRRRDQERREDRERKRTLFARMKRDAMEATKRRKAREAKEKRDDMETIRVARERGTRSVVGEPVDSRLIRLAKQRLEDEYRAKEDALMIKYGKKRRTGVRITQPSGGNSVASDLIYGDRLVAQKNSVKVLRSSGGGQSDAFDIIYGGGDEFRNSYSTSVRVLKPSGDNSTVEDILTGKPDHEKYECEGVTTEWWCFECGRCDLWHVNIGKNETSVKVFNQWWNHRDRWCDLRYV